MELYRADGYVDMRAIMALGYPFTIVCGGRATGKTFGTLDAVRSDALAGKGKFMLMRRSQAQADMINRQDFSPFKSIDLVNGSQTVSLPVSRYSSAFYDAQTDEEGAVIPHGSPLGYTCALSTISNMRGFDASDVVVLVYDEFIPERHERPLKNEAEALLNAYETINRNRELEGRPPLQLVALSNANDLGNPVFLELELVRQAELMHRKGIELWTNDERGICLVILRESPISQAKRKTALYRLSGNSSFAAMSLDNEFSAEDRSTIRSLPLRELRPLVQVGECCIYEHKSRHLFYVSPHSSGSPERYGAGSTELERFRRSYRWLWQEYLMDNLVFEEYLMELLLNKYFTGK